MYVCVCVCGLSEYALPPYLASVGVVTTDVLSNGKAPARGSSTDLTDDDNDMI